MALNTWAQTDTTEVKFDKKNVEVITDEWGDTTYIRVDSKLYKVIEGDNGKYVKVATDEWGDTTQINVGNQSYKVIDDNNGKNVNEVKVGKKNVVTVIEDGDNVHVVVGDKEKGKALKYLPTNGATQRTLELGAARLR